MLHLFNRAVLLDTASLDRQVKIRDLLLMNGFEVVVKVMVHTPIAASATQMNRKFGEKSKECIYRIYVRRSLLSDAIRLVKKHNA